MTTFAARTAGNGVVYRAAIQRNRVVPATTRNPWLKQVFDEQDRLNIPNKMLAKMAGVPQATISNLRHPSQGGGKRPFFNDVVNLVEAMDFRFPEKLVKNGD